MKMKKKNKRIKKEKMKTITILLTGYSNWFGRFIRVISRSGYSHASISIDGSEEVFYSFNGKGMVIEKPKKYKPKARKEKSVCIRIRVPECICTDVEREIQQFLEQKDIYSYSWLGVILCLLHIPHKFENAYFCSQFVAEILSKSGAVKLNKKESLYLPNHLMSDIECLFSGKQIAYNVI
jgi:inositol transport system substrate-binding protein